MPSGAKKRKALKKKKKEQEAIGASPSNKGFDGHGTDFSFETLGIHITLELLVVHTLIKLYTLVLVCKNLFWLVLFL